MKVTENEINLALPNNYIMSDSGDKLINVNTGEVKRAVATLLPEGSRILTPEQQEAIAKKRKKICRIA